MSDESMSNREFNYIVKKMKGRYIHIDLSTPITDKSLHGTEFGLTFYGDQVPEILNIPEERYASLYDKFEYCGKPSYIMVKVSGTGTNTLLLDPKDGMLPVVKKQF